MTDLLLDAALEYAARGWPVFPLEGKEPITSSGVKDATTDEGKIREWWKAHPRANIGLACGEASAVVVDDDGPLSKPAIAEYARVHGIETADEDLSTSRVKTSKGEHLYFGWSEGCEKLKNWTKPIPDTDIRTTGGYVVAPPSIHPDTGEPYTWIISPDNGNLRPFPSWLVDLLLEAKAKKRTEKLEKITTAANKQKVERHRDDGASPYGKAALEYEIATLRATPEGERNNTLNTAALKLFSLVKGGALGRGEVERELTRVARSLGLKDPEISKTLESAWTGATAREIPDDGPKATTSATGGREKSGETEDDGIKSISEEELQALPAAENPRLSVCLEPDNFISEYVAYASSLSDAYVEYHYAAALFMVSTAVDRRAVLKLKQMTVHPNLWLFCLGDSTTSRKTTSLNTPIAILDTYEVGRRLPSSFSPEALIEALADCPSSFFIKDEAGSLLASMGKKYMEETRDFFSELYENKDYHRKLRTGQRKEKREFHIKSPYVTQWLVTTPDNFSAYTTELDVTSGWLLRYVYFWPDYVKPWKAFEEATDEDFSRYMVISMKYRDIKEKLAVLEPEGLKLSLTAEGWEYFSNWQRFIEERATRDDDRVAKAIAGRLMAVALKLAMVFTVGRSDFDPSTTRDISLEHVQEATRQVETYFLPTARAVIDEVAKNDRENHQNRIIKVIRNAGGKIARRNLLRKLHIKLSDVDNAIEALVASEEIETLKVEDGKGPTKYVYRLTVSNVPTVPSVPTVPTVTQIRGNSTRSVKPDRDKFSAFEETDGTEGTVATVGTGETPKDDHDDEGGEVAGEMPEPSDEYETIAENLEEAARREAAYLEKFKTPEPKAKGRRLERLYDVPRYAKNYGILYQPAGKALEYSPWAANVAKSCSHGCEYCYAPAVARKTGDKYRDVPDPKTDLIKRINAGLTRALEDGCNIPRVHLTFAGDFYDPRAMEGSEEFSSSEEMTRAVIEAIHSHGVGVQILTKGREAARDFDLLGPRDRFGVSLTFLDPEKSKEWEPGAALPDERIENLRGAKEKGLTTWVSLEPVIDPAATLELVRRSAEYVDIFAVGKWNHDKRADKIDWHKFAADVVKLLESLGCDYYIKDDLKRYLPSERSETKKVVERSTTKNDLSEEGGDGRIFNLSQPYWRDLAKQHHGLNTRVLKAELGYDDLKAGMCLDLLRKSGWITDYLERLQPPGYNDDEEVIS